MRLLLIALLAVSVAVSAQAKPRPGPARAAPATEGPVMVAAANPAAVEAGLKVLRAGGSAVDAAVAVQATLGLVEPQSSGLGGGAFMVFYDARTRQVTAYDGREFAPAGATPDMFMRPDGKPMSYPEAVLSGRSAGVPGAVAMLALAHRQHGVRPWSSLFGEAERLARDGFTVGPRLQALAASGAPQAKAPDVVAYLSRPGGGTVKAGDVVKNPAYAATVRLVAAKGPAALLQGPIARAIVLRLSQGPLPGTMTLADLKAYQPHVGPALCRPYRIYIVCVPQLPSGGSALLQALGLLEHTDIDKRGPTDAVAWLQIAQAERLMYADRDRYVGDPAFVKVPLEGMLDPAYVAERAKLIVDPIGPPPAPGTPPGAAPRAADATTEPGGTSHFVVVDAKGNVVSMTTTVESVFGDGRMVSGFFLNNQLTDFSYNPRDASGALVANAVGPRKRPRSSMSPAIVLTRDGRFYAAVGSPGGTSIPSYVLKALVGVLDWKMSMQDAVALPNLVARGTYFGSEPDRFAPGVVDAIAAHGVKLNGAFGEASGLHGALMRDGQLTGGADPRREGVARGF